MPSIFVAAIIITFLRLSVADAQVYNIIDFGARTDTTVNNSKFIQSAIDQCHLKGGGEVIVPAGTFYSGTIFLKSNVYLHLLPGSVLQGSYNPADYPDYNIRSAKKFGTITHNGLYVEYMKALIIADSTHQTGIIGRGTIKGAGEGEAFQLGLNKDGKPKNIFFIRSKDVVLKDIRIFNSAQITVSISGCERVNIDGIYIRSLVNWNADGLDVDGKDITISNCIIDSEDDALCFKSEYLGKFCENITVSNCILSSLCNGIKLGTGSRTGFRNITVNNCVVKKASFNGYRHWKMPSSVVFNPEIQSVNTGIVILGVDGGLVENINFSNIIMKDVLSPFFIRVGKRFVNPRGKPSGMRHVTIQNVTAESRSILPSIIAGLEDSPIENVKLSNIRISIPIYVSSDSLKTFPRQLSEDVKGYPENRLTFGLKIPASAFYIRNADRITLQDVAITNVPDEARPAIYLDKAIGVKLQNVSINNKSLKSTPLQVVSSYKSQVAIVD